jgi:hypothetical protein
VNVGKWVVGVVVFLLLLVVFNTGLLVLEAARSNCQFGEGTGASVCRTWLAP